MKKNPTLKYAGLGLAALLCGSAAVSQAQTILTTSYTNSFPIGSNTTNFSGSGSVASWIYWYNTPGGNLPMTCDVGIDANGNTSTSGALEMDSPFGTSGTQNVVFGTFDNQWGYDFNTVANLVNYTNITFDIMVPKGTPPTANGDFGVINVGIINNQHNWQVMGSPTIPGAASNGWVHMTVPIDPTQDNISAAPGLGFSITSWGGYPQFYFTNYIDNLELHLSPVQAAPPTLSGNIQKAAPGLNEIASQAGQPYNRYQVRTVNSNGMSFYGHPSVTYSWNVQAFPKNADPYSFQQHFIIAAGSPGPYDQAADYNLANIIFMTVQATASGQGVMNFRYKTNEPAGNGMLFNATSPTNTAGDPNGWPIEPVSTLTAASTVGNWSITFANNNNVTITGPGGATTNFVMDAASAALFADPATLILGGQPNDSTGYGEGVVYGSFSATGNGAPFTDNFLTDSSLNTNIWADLSSDPNGDIFVPQGSAFWVDWSLPDSGFSLETSSNLLGSSKAWNIITPTTIANQGSRQALIPASSLAATDKGFFRLIELTPTQLQVLLPGETNAPGTPTGKVGIPTPAGVYDNVTVTVNEVDQNFNIVSSSDTVNITSSDSGFIIDTDPLTLVNGTATDVVNFATSGSQTITAQDTTNTNITSSTSSPITIQ